MRALHAWAQPGKDIVVISTALLWGAGMVAWSNDTAFTLTNVIAHGVRHAVLVMWTAPPHRAWLERLARAIIAALAPARRARHRCDVIPGIGLRAAAD